MNINYITQKVFNFIVKRIVELIGIFLAVLSILLIVSLISYSPEDPNFIFPKEAKIENILGYKGSVISDIFFQSIGLISFLVSFTLFFTGINIFKNKKILLILENFFFVVLYAIFGSLFFSVYYSESFWLTINGNGGFIGNFLKDSFLFSLIKVNENISYYVLLFITLIGFLLSIKFNIKTFYNFLKKVFVILKIKK